MVLPQSFYNRSALRVARDLLGCFLVRKTTGLSASSPVKFMIVETEAYCGPKDLASHSSRGLTERNKVMFGPPGFFYVYFTYGLHYLVNVVTGPGNFPSAALIRALEPISNADKNPSNKKIDKNSSQAIHNLYSGPARLTKTLGIDKIFNGQPAFQKKSGLWIESGSKLKPLLIARATRIGIDYAGDYKDKKWRFYIKGSNFISKK